MRRKSACVYSHSLQKSTDEEAQITTWQCIVPGKNRFSQYLYEMCYNLDLHKLTPLQLLFSLNKKNIYRVIKYIFN